MRVSNTFTCRLVTPTQKLVDEAVTYASVPAWDGLFGVLPRRAPLMARLGLGELSLAFPQSGSAAGGSRSYLVDGGFVQMAGDTLTVLADRAIPTETLTEAEAQAELAEAEARTVPADAPDRETQLQRLRADKARARLKLRLAQAARGRGI